MANPVFVDGVAAAKSSARAFIPFVLDTRDTLRSTDMGGSWLVYVREVDRWFERDTSDTTSPDDGTSVIVDPIGNRWKSAQAVLGGIRIDAAGSTATRADYDDAPQPFVYYDVEAELAYVKQSNDTADWSPGFSIRGPTAPPNALSIGTVNVGSAGAAITGDPPAQILNLVLPPGPPNSLAIGIVEAGETAAATLTGVAPSQTLNLVLPRGPKGEGVQIDAVGDLVDRDLYDDEPKGFTFLATDTAALYVKRSNATADWSAPVAFGAGIIDNVIELEEVATPGAPSPGRHKLYVKADGRLYKQASSGGETALAFGTGIIDNVIELEEVATPGAPSPGSHQLYVKSDGRLYKQAASGGEIALLSSGDEDQGPITGGAGITPKDLGTVSSGTVTVDVRDRPVHMYVNNGAHTLDVAANPGSTVVIITNGASAGAITTSAFNVVAGNAFTTTNGHVFRCVIEYWGSGRKWLFIERVV